MRTVLMAAIGSLVCVLMTSNLADACGGRHHGGGGHGRNGGGGGFRGGVTIDVPSPPDARPYGDPEPFAPQPPDESDGDGPPPPEAAAPPQNPACAEIAQLNAQLEQKWELRHQIAAGKKTFIMGPGMGLDGPAVNVKKYRQQQQEQIALDSGTNNEAAARIQSMNSALVQMQQASLALLDSQIANIQDRLGQLAYDCPQ